MNDAAINGVSSNFAVSAARGQTLISLRGLTKEYRNGEVSVAVLSDLSFDVAAGAFEALMGPSGSGKSTLLNLIAGLDRPSRGSIEVAGSRLDQMSEAKLASWRAQTVGFVFQSYNLLPVLTALENVEMPLLLTPLDAAQRAERARTALRVVGLEARARHFPTQLSGGQQQRVAIARAIVTDPQIVVADEPTGDLDRESADAILDLLQRLNQESKKTILMVTHDPAAAMRAQVIRRLDKGLLQ